MQNLLINKNPLKIIMRKITLRGLNDDIFSCGVVCRMRLDKMNNMEEPCDSNKSPVVPTQL